MKKLTKLIIFVIWLQTCTAYVGRLDNSEMEYNNDLGNCSCEVEVYEADVEYGIIKSPNYPNFQGCNGRCIYKILPHPEKSVSLFVSNFELSPKATLIVYSLLIVHGHEIQIQQSKFKRPSNYYYNSEEHNFPGFVSAKNAGFEIHFKSNADKYDMISFKMSFDRFSEHEHLCAYPIVEIGMEETVIQEPHQLESASGCVYILKPKRGDGNTEDEMIINIESSKENLVAIGTLDEGKRVFKSTAVPAKRSVITSAYNVEILSRKTSKKNSLYKLAKVTGKLIKRNCDCGQSEFVIDGKINTSYSIRSPGYPHLYCPNIDCIYAISATNSSSTNSKIAIFEVKVYAVLGTNDIFTLRSKSTPFIEIMNFKAHPKHVKYEIVVKQQALELNYVTFTQPNERRFEMNISQILIPPECVCSFFKDETRDAGKDLEFQTDFPAMCTYIYCNYRFQDPSGYNEIRSVLEFQVRNAIDGDVVTISNKNYSEKYQGAILHHVRSFESQGLVDFTFYRKNFNTTEQIVLNLKYTRLENEPQCSSVAQEIRATTDKPAIIASPGYPQMYENNQHCKFLVSVPDNCHMTLNIDEVNVEIYHDHVKIYEGNSTSGKLLEHFTGRVMQKTLNISSNTAFIDFITDQSTTDRGFHITAKAYQYKDYSGKDDHTGKNVMIAFLLILIVLLIVAGFVVFKKDIGQVIARRIANQQQQPQPALEQAPEQEQPLPNLRLLRERLARFLQRLQR